jgi:hypothetical protein
MITKSRTVAENRMKLLAQTLYETGIITAVVADKSRNQFSDLCLKASSTLQIQFSAFSRTKCRLDTFYFDIIGQDPDYAELFSVVRLVLILSHGNATVEGGFSVNGDMLVENLQDESLVAQRIVYDAVQCAGGITSVHIDKALLSFVRGSHARYLLALDQKRQTSSEYNKQQALKRKAAAEINQLEMKKAKVLKAAASEAKATDTEISVLKKHS